MNASHEAIHKSLFIQARGILKKELPTHLRSHRMMRRGRTSMAAGQTRGQITGAISIRDRPAEIEDRAIPGQRERDFLSDVKNNHFTTLVERSSRFAMLVQVNGKGSDCAVGTLIRQVSNVPNRLMTSPNCGCGTEHVYHRKFTIATEVSVFSATPKAPSTASFEYACRAVLGNLAATSTPLVFYANTSRTRQACLFTPGTTSIRLHSASTQG